MSPPRASSLARTGVGKKTPWIRVEENYNGEKFFFLFLSSLVAFFNPFKMMFTLKNTPEPREVGDREFFFLWLSLVFSCYWRNTVRSRIRGETLIWLGE